MTLPFPKSARLISRRDFTFKRFVTKDLGAFKVLVGSAGSGRIGISISKKIVKSAVGRNRVKRLLREGFRMDRARLHKVDLHVIGKNPLGSLWKKLKLEDIKSSLDQLLH